MLVSVSGLVWAGTILVGIGEIQVTGTGNGSKIDQARSLPLGFPVPATPNSPVHWAMLHGFAEPETDGTWIVTLEGALEIGVPDGAASLLIELYPYLPDGVAQRTIAIESQENVDLVTLSDGITVVQVPAQPNSQQRITIGCDFTVSPFVLGEGPDKRTLCVKLLSVEIVPAG